MVGVRRGVGTVLVLSSLALSLHVHGAKFSQYKTCSECVAAGFGWSTSAGGKCGGYKNRACSAEAAPTTAEAPPPVPPAAETLPVSNTDAWDKAAAGWTAGDALVETQRATETYFSKKTWDPRGYLIVPLASYPIGKFAIGNQAEYLLAKLAMAKDLDRCLVLPDMTDLLGTLKKPPGDMRFEQLFDPIHIDRQQCVIDVKTFLKLADKHWRHRQAFFGQTNKMHKWYDEHNITFDGGYMEDGEKRLVMFYHKLITWGKDTPAFRNEIAPRRYPVLATSGGYSELPASPPIAKYQASLTFAPWIKREAAKFIATRLKGKFLGIHVRNAPDWKYACEQGGITHAKDQCTVPLSMDECLPPLELVVREAKVLIAKFGLSSIFLAAKKSRDNESFGVRLVKALQDLGLQVATPDFDVPWIDLEILNSAHVFVGNCGSTMSAYTYRDRTITRKVPHSYFSGQVWKIEVEAGKEL